MKTLELELSNTAYQRFKKKGKLPANVLKQARKLIVDFEGKLAIDTEPADNGAHRTQQGWANYHNEQRKVTIAPEHVLESKGDVRKSLQEDTKRWLITGTGVDYILNTEEGRIVYNRGSTVVPERSSKKIKIPILRGVPLPEALKRDGLRYYILLFNERFTTEKKLTDALVDFSGKKPEQIISYTSSQGNRNSYPKSDVGFNDYLGWFIVNGNMFDYGSGRSRGVSLNTASVKRR